MNEFLSRDWHGRNICNNTAQPQIPYAQLWALYMATVHTIAAVGALGMAANCSRIQGCQELVSEKGQILDFTK